MVSARTGCGSSRTAFYYYMLRNRWQIDTPQGAFPVGLLPMCAVTVVEKWQRDRVPNLTEHLFDRLKRMPELRESIDATGPGHLGVAERGIFGLVNESRLRRILTRVLDENEFLSAYGIRSLSRYHADHPYVFSVGVRNIASAICRRNRISACLVATPTGAAQFGCR